MKTPSSINLDQSIITRAVEHLRKGELVAFPTETVYGLGADAANEDAIKKLYAVKGRPGNHPVIVHLASFEQINDWCDELPEYVRLLAKNFWPGPLTLIVKKAKHVSNLLTGGQDTIGLRVPAHPIALALLETFAGGIAAPSANKYGRISATQAVHVQEEFGGEVGIIIDGGNCPVGIESTIVDATGPIPKILRPGIILEKDLLDKIGSTYIEGHQESLDSNEANIRVPGSDKSHYAPRTPMILCDKVSLKSLLNEQDTGSHYALLAFSAANEFDNKQIKKYIHASVDAILYARDLYDNLRKLDRAGANYIIVEAPKELPEWIAIADRLKRASTKLQER